MADNLILEIESLHDQVGDLMNNMGEDGLLSKNFLSACSDLLEISKKLQNGSGFQSASGEEERTSLSISLLSAVKMLFEAHDAIREINERYRAVVDSEGVFICRISTDGSIHFANQSLIQYLNLSSSGEQILNFFDYLDQSHARVWQNNIAALSLEAPEFTITHPFHLPDHQTGWQQWNCRALFDPDGNLVEVVGVGYDVSSMKLAELATEQRNRELSALHSAARALLTTLDTETLLGQILDAVIGAVPAAQKGTIHLIARDTGQLELRASIGYADPRIKKFSYSESSGYVAKSVRERRPLIFHDASGELPNPRKSLIPEMGDIRSVIVAPLILKDRVLGAISLESVVPSAFSESDLNLLVSFAVTATNAIHNAGLHAEMQKLAITDALTGIYNRRGLDELGQREIERSFRFKHPLTAVMIDVDRLKDINDKYGHFAGDHVLRKVANICKAQLRKVDILGRYGGDEFLILLPETHVRLGTLVADRLRRSVFETHIPTDNELVRASISLGVAGLTTEITDLEALISRADSAMYAEKQSVGSNMQLP